MTKDQLIESVEKFISDIEQHNQPIPSNWIQIKEWLKQMRNFLLMKEYGLDEFPKD